MHTVYVIVGGLLLLAIFAGFGRALGGRRGGQLLLAYIPVWLACAAFNMWLGLTRGRYPLAEELPAFLLVFGVPATLALALARYRARRTA